jgi:hypothetical protein
MMTHPRAATKAVTILAPLLQKTPLAKDSVASFLNQPIYFTLLCKCDLASRAINLFSSRTYTDISLLLIKQLEYSRYFYLELLAFLTVNLPLCLP